MHQYDVFIGLFGALAALALLAYASRWISALRHARGYLEYASLGSIYGGFVGVVGLLVFFLCSRRLGLSDEFEWYSAPVWAIVCLAGAVSGLAVRYARRPQRTRDNTA